MPAIRVFIDDVEVNPCEHGVKILRMLRTCEPKGKRQGYLRRLRGLSKLLPNDTTLPPPRKSGGPGLPSPSPGLGTTAASTTSGRGPVPDASLFEGQPELVTDSPFLFGSPESEDPTPFIPVDQPRLPARRGGSIPAKTAFQLSDEGEPGGSKTLVRVPGQRGLVPGRERKEPLDLMLAKAVKNDTAFGRAVSGLSHGFMKLMPLGHSQNTITETLGQASGQSNEVVHAFLGASLLEVPFAGKKIAKALSDESDFLLLNKNVSDLEKTLVALKDTPTNPGSTTRKLRDRIEGNLNILRFED